MVSKTYHQNNILELYLYNVYKKARCVFFIYIKIEPDNLHYENIYVHIYNSTARGYF